MIAGRTIIGGVLALVASAACAGASSSGFGTPPGARRAPGAGAPPPEVLAAATGASSRLLYVVNQAGASIAVIDPARRVVDTTIDLTALGFTANAKPHHVAVEPDGSAWYVSLIGDGRVLKFSRDNRLLGQVAMETPGLLALDPAHDSLFVGRSMTAVNPPKALGVIARGPFRLVDEQEIVVPRPHAIGMSVDGTYVLTASLAENRIAAVATATGQVTLSSIPGASRSMVMFALSPDGRTLVTGGELSNTLLVFDLSQPPPYAPVKEIPVSGKPWEVRFANATTAYVTLLSANAIAEVNVASGTVTRTITGRFAQPYSMLLSEDGTMAYVVSQNGQPVSEKGSGHEGHGMASPDAVNGWLSFVDLRTGEVVTELPLGRGPTGMGAAGVR